MLRSEVAVGHTVGAAVELPVGVEWDVELGVVVRYLPPVLSVGRPPSVVDRFWERSGDKTAHVRWVGLGRGALQMPSSLRPRKGGCAP